MANILYIRVSTAEQETARQEALIEQYKIEKVFLDKATGKNTDRPQFKAMMNYLREGEMYCTPKASRACRVLSAIC